MARNFCGLAIFFLFCLELFFAIRTDCFSCRELIFAIFGKYPLPSIDNTVFSYFLSTCTRNTYFQTISQSLNERDKL